MKNFKYFREKKVEKGIKKEIQKLRDCKNLVANYGRN